MFLPSAAVNSSAVYHTGVGFVTHNFLCFLGNVEETDVDDAGRPLVPLRVILALRNVLRIDLEMCVVKYV